MLFFDTVLLFDLPRVNVNRCALEQDLFLVLKPVHKHMFYCLRRLIEMIRFEKGRHCFKVGLLSVVIIELIWNLIICYRLII